MFGLELYTKESYLHLLRVLIIATTVWPCHARLLSSTLRQSHFAGWNGSEKRIGCV